MVRQIHTPLKCGGGLALAIEAALFNLLTHFPVWILGPQCPWGHHGHQGDREMLHVIPMGSLGARYQVT